MEPLVCVLLVLDVQDACGVIVTAECRMTYVEIAELPIDKVSLGLLVRLESIECY